MKLWLQPLTHDTFTEGDMFSDWGWLSPGITGWDQPLCPQKTPQAGCWHALQEQATVFILALAMCPDDLTIFAGKSERSACPDMVESPR